jgi:hypothetical protein
MLIVPLGLSTKSCCGKNVGERKKRRTKIVLECCRTLSGLVGHRGEIVVLEFKYSTRKKVRKIKRSTNAC